MNKKGFTLVELLAVIAILAILIIIALPNVLKMLNDAKKNSFLTEAKTVYSEVSKKYISESMKGNKLSYVSSEDDTKLEITGRDLQYCVFLNTDGTIKKMQVSNREYVVELSGNKNISDLNINDLKDGNLDDEECGPNASISFEDDSWKIISDHVKSGKTKYYNVGDQKQVTIDGIDYTVRIANKSTPDVCNTEEFSQTACGFVVEFVDVVEDNVGFNFLNKGEVNWKDSDLRGYVNNEFFNKLPTDLQDSIIETKVISGHGTNDESDFETTDKVYLLSTKEVYNSDWTTAKDKQRQLDYYSLKNVSSSTNKEYVVKKYNGENTSWWLRTKYSGYTHYMQFINNDGNATYGAGSHGISPAFRIG